MTAARTAYAQWTLAYIAVLRRALAQSPIASGPPPRLRRAWPRTIAARTASAPGTGALTAQPWQPRAPRRTANERRRAWLNKPQRRRPGACGPLRLACCSRDLAIPSYSGATSSMRGALSGTRRRSATSSRSGTPFSMELRPMPSSRCQALLPPWDSSGLAATL